MSLIDRMLVLIGLQRIRADRPRLPRLKLGQVDPETERKYAEAMKRIGADRLSP